MKTARRLAFLFLAASFTAGSAQTYTFTTIAGAAGSGYVNGPGNVARFLGPAGVAVDENGNMFVADIDMRGGGLTSPGIIRKITSAGVVTTLSSEFSEATGVAADGSGNVFVADSYASMIFKLSADGVGTKLAGGQWIVYNKGTSDQFEGGESGSNDGTGSEARFAGPSGVAVDGSGNVFVADTSNHTIRKITASGIVTTLAGSAANPGSRDGTGSAARFNFPKGVAVDGSGNVFVADTENNAIRKITAAGVVTTLSNDFYSPQGVAVDGSGNLFVADTGNHTIRKITADGVVTTLSNSTGTSGSEDGTGNVARFNSPSGVAVDRSGNLYIADTLNHTIRKGVPNVFATFARTGPQSQHVNSGAGAIFTVTPATSGLGFQWKKDGVAITGATSDTYQIGRTAVADMGFYTVAVIGPAGPLESPVAILTVATGGTSRLGNFSARGLVPAGGDLTVGFALRGGGGKSVLVRAVGPTLGSFGVPGALADPRLDVFAAGTSIATGSNDDWGGGPVLADEFSSVGAFPLAAASKDAAVLSTLAIGAYSARVTSSLAGGSGIVLTEVYDRDPAGAVGRLINISALSSVGASTSAFTLGFLIDGTASKQLLLRAVGPGLTPLGVTGVLGAPQLSVIPLGKMFTVASNDNWAGDEALATAFVSAGAFALPSNSKDAAVVVRLPPGGYTVNVSGSTDATGRALVEIYDLDP